MKIVELVIASVLIAVVFLSFVVLFTGLIAAGLWLGWNHSFGTLGMHTITYVQSIWFVILASVARSLVYPNNVANVVSRVKSTKKS